MARELDSLVQLENALQEAATARRQLEGVPDSMREIHDEHQVHLHRIEELEEQIRNDELTRRSAEAAASDAQGRLEHYQSQINRVTTQREYGSLLKEIDAVKAIVSAHEEEALSLLERIDEAQQELERERTEFEELDRRYQAQLARWEEEKPAVAAHLKLVEEDIERFREAIPPHLLRQFELLYERHEGHALAPVSKVQPSPRAPAVWHCSVCNYRVRPQVIVEIKNNGSLVQCESCHRFLYLEVEA